MEFQIAEAIELIKTLAETENLTQSQALTAFVAEAGLDVEYASQLKAALFESYTLQEMASDSMTKALYSVFVAGESGVEDIQEVDTKETQEGTKYKVRVKDRASGSSYVRYATREKIAELRANPNISSVELTDYGATGEDDRGEKTAAAKGGGGKDYDGDGKKESSSKEHAGVVHNAIQRAKGGTPDGQDTRKEEVEQIDEIIDPKGARRIDAAKGKKAETQDEKEKRLMMGKYSPAVLYAKKKTQSEEVEVEEGIDFKGAKRIDDARAAEKEKKYKKSPSSKDKDLMLRKFRPGASREERKSGYRDIMREKGIIPKKNGKKMYEAYLELRADKKKISEGSVEEGYKGRHGQSDEEHMDSRSDAGKMISGNSKMSGAKYTHGNRVSDGGAGPTKPNERPKAQGRMDSASREDLAYRKANLKKKEAEKKTRNEDFLPEADLVDSGRENQSQRDKKKLDGKGVDNSRNVVLMPVVDESIKTEHDATKSQRRLSEASRNDDLRSQIRAMAEECCPNCGTPKCTCDEEKKEEAPKKKKAKLDEAGMPIFETKAESRNNARPGPSKDMIDPPADPLGPPGHMNPKGEPKRYKEVGEAPGDRRPNRKKDKSLPNEDGTVPNGSGV